MHEQNTVEGIENDNDGSRKQSTPAAHSRRRRRAGQSGTQAHWQRRALLLPLLSLFSAAQPGNSQYLPPLPPLGFFGGLLNGFGMGTPSPAVVANPPAPPAASIAAASDLVPGHTPAVPAADRSAADPRPAGMQPNPNAAAQPQPAAPAPQAVPVPVTTPAPGGSSSLFTQHRLHDTCDTLLPHGRWQGSLSVKASGLETACTAWI